MPSTSPGRPSWSTVKGQVAALSPVALIALVGDLYRASPENRRFLHTRFLGPDAEITKYRTLVRDAVSPDGFSRQPIRIGEAQRLIRHYRHATHDLPGTLDLLLTFVEAGAEQAVDLGHGDERYFVALERALDDAVQLAERLSATAHLQFVARVRQLAHRASDVGWGFGDYVVDALAGLS